MGAGGSAGDAFQLWPAGALLVVKVLSAEPVLWRSMQARAACGRAWACFVSSEFRSHVYACFGFVCGVFRLHGSERRTA